MTQMLAFLEPAEESALLASAATQIHEPEDVIVEQNATLQALYVIVRGSVSVERVNGSQAVELAILAPGEFFGEVSFVDGSPASARVIAREPTELRVVTPALIAGADQPEPTFAARFYRSLAAILAERLRKTSLNVW